MEPGGGNDWHPDRHVCGRRMSTRAAAALALASMTVGSVACAARAEQVRRTLSQYRDALRLSLAAPSVVVVGEDTPLQFRLQNSGSVPIDTCVGEAREVRVVPENDTDGIEGATVSATTVERPGCARRVRLAPGAQVEWSEPTTVTGIVRGFATLEVDVQIVDPRHCDPSVGCPEMRLTASAPVNIR